MDGMGWIGYACSQPCVGRPFTSVDPIDRSIVVHHHIPTEDPHHSTTPQSKAPPGFEAPLPAAAAATKKRTRRVRAREEKYWAEQQQEKEKEQEQETETAAAPEEAEPEEDAAAALAEASSRGGPLSAELLQRVARAKEAERARKIHEALAVLEMARWVGRMVCVRSWWL